MDITLFITAHSACDTDYLPRLYRIIQEAKSGLETPYFMIDTGQAWSADGWLSLATEHRAGYFIMDAMGYNAAFADGLGDDGWQRAQPHMQLKLIPPDATAILTYQQQYRFRVRRDVTLMEVIIDDGVLVLPMPPKGTLALVQITLDSMTIQQKSVMMVTELTLPHPTIVGAIEFVESEARYYQKKRGDTS